MYKIKRNQEQHCENRMIMSMIIFCITAIFVSFIANSLQFKDSDISPHFSELRALYVFFLSNNSSKTGIVVTQLLTEKRVLSGHVDLDSVEKVPS